MWSLSDCGQSNSFIVPSSQKKIEYWSTSADMFESNVKNDVLLDVLSPYFYPNDQKNNEPVRTPPDHYTLGPPVLQAIPDLSDEGEREIWLGERPAKDRKCPKKYLEYHGIKDNMAGAAVRFRGPP